MRAVVATEPGGPEVLRVVQRPDPVPGSGELLVRVVATAVNRADVLQRRGMYPPPPGASDVLGLEASGVVETLGSEVTGWSVGDPVCAVLPGGGHAELVVVPASVSLPVPPGLSLVEAAAVPEVFTTAYDNVLVR
ncbi:MAG: alcohol dehydrogenase catalytic domain-containing protein, partial [Actinomycetota bacterium]|nr:alcohol dehydrogenase catalytic domain-containing protein [Actinomycetota bacterium]